jgi:PKD repeat protein
LLLALPAAFAADVVPTDVKMPGTQPEDAITPLEPVGFCANCHGNYDQAVEPLFNWRGSMMSHSSRDPVFWATLAVAEQDFDGAGDLCIRCHSAAGWLEGRSTPTDGSALDPANDVDGIECDLCHRLTNPDRSEHLGVQVDPFVAITGDPSEAHYGSGQYVLAGGAGTKYGPYADANPPAGAHAAARSRFHRSPELCGTCHDVSNPAVGDLAYNHGAQIPLADGTYSGVPGADVQDKAAFNNPPYKYGIVERTYSEHKAGLLGSTLVRDYAALPAELQAGAIQRAYEAALLAGRGGDYADGTPRYFTCQTCHLRPVTGKGAGRPPTGRFVPPVRSDLPLHDLTGGNYWMPEAIKWLDARGRLVVGGGLTAADIAAMDAGALRARENLEDAATLSVAGDTVKVVNLTSHKLISGYPEGRRMWLNIRWRSNNGALLREDGAYGDLMVDLDGDGVRNDTVRTLLELQGTNTRIYEVHHAITPEWAAQLLDLGYPPDMVVSYDRTTGQPSATLETVANGTKYEESLHFVLNDYVSYDRRIPPYGFSYDEAKRRNALPVPEDQFGNPGPGGTYRHWDEVVLNPPAGAVSAEIRLLYQPTSWEYVQFLYLANPGTGHLANAGRDYLEAWLATGMAEPHLMASATWTSSGPAPGPNQSPIASFIVGCTDLDCSFDASGSDDPDGSIAAYAWDFGDGATGSGVTASYSYAVAGTYTVTLTVTDDRGASASTAQDVTVSAPPVNQPPAASFTFTCTDLTCSFNGGGSSDPDGTISAYAWTFGDGATAAGVTASHTFAVAGAYDVTLTVTDNGGLTGTLTQQVDVTAPAPQPGPGPGPRR